VCNRNDTDTHTHTYTTTRKMSQSDYCKYYQSQRGGELPVFRGGSQGGAGLGDILRGIFRFLMPVALRGIQSFASNTLAGTQRGIPLPMAAKSAIMPTITAIAGSAAPMVSRLVETLVPGLASQQTGRGVLFDGVNGVPTTAKAIQQYKRNATMSVSDAPPAKQRKRKAEKHGHNISSSGVHYNF